MDGGSSALFAATSDSFYAPANAAYASASATPSTPAINPSAMMAAGFGMQALSGFAGAFAQNRALQSQGKYQANMFEFNKNVANLQAKDAIDRGNFSANQEKQRIAGTIGEERAGIAGQGVQVDSGSAAEVQENTKNIGAMNAITIKNNAWKEAWGYKTQAISSGFQGQFAQMSADNQAYNTLLTGGINSVADIGKGIGAYEGYYRGNGGGANPGMRY